MAELENEQAQLARNPEYGLQQLTRLIYAEGIDQPLARQVARQLTEKDPLTAHARLELGIDPKDRSNPWQAGTVTLDSV